MFFPRLRRQAKWVFVGLVLVFGIGFVVFNVGSGNGVGGLGSLLNNNNTSGGVSESSARDRIQKNPNDAQAYLDLASALETKGDLKGEIEALKQYSKLRPKDTDALATLAGVYTTQGSRLQSQVQAAYSEAQTSQLNAAFDPGFQLKGQLIVPPNPIFQAVSAVKANRVSELSATQQKDFSSAEDVYKRIVRITPRDATAQLNLGQVAQQAGDKATAIAAYTRFIQLAPDDPTAPIVRQQIKTLRKPATASGG
jgi:tetratricopeptide (TPR) repeat protein